MDQWATFWPSLLANFFGSLAASGLVGLVLTIFVGRKISERLNRLERTEQRKDDERSHIVRLIDVIGLLQEEAQKIDVSIPQWYDTFKEYSWGKLIIIDTPAWDSVKNNSDALSGYSPELMKALIELYSMLARVNRHIDLVVSMWFMNAPAIAAFDIKQREFYQAVLKELENAQPLVANLRMALDNEITNLNTKLRLVNSPD